MKYSLSIIFIVVFLCQCKEPTIDLPIEKDELVSLLADHHIMEIALRQANADKRDSLKTTYEAQILDIYNITSSELDYFIAELKKHPEEYHDIYKVVVDTLKGFGKPK